MTDKATEAEAALAAVTRWLLPEVAPLLWKVRNDLPARDMGEVVAERMRLLGRASLWRGVEALELCLAADRAEQPGC